MSFCVTVPESESTPKVTLWGNLNPSSTKKKGMGPYALPYFTKYWSLVLGFKAWIRKDTGKVKQKSRVAKIAVLWMYELRLGCFIFGRFFFSDQTAHYTSSSLIWAKHTEKISAKSDSVCECKSQLPITGLVLLILRSWQNSTAKSALRVHHQQCMILITSPSPQRPRHVWRKWLSLFQGKPFSVDLRCW